MKTLYIECNMGAAGDMLMGALYELLDNKEEFLEKMNSFFPGIVVKADNKLTCGITGTHMHVVIDGEEEETIDMPAGHVHEHEHDHEHHHDHGHHHHDHDHGHHHAHTSFAEICHILDHADLPEAVKEHAKAIYQAIAEAESKVHGSTVEQIHFHEVGSLDAVADVTGACLAFHMLKAERIIVSPIHVGKGQVRCAHGIVPIPTPATVELLKGVPCYAGDIFGELCTPTGAAILTHFADSYGSMPQMCIEKTGYGIGTKEFPAANCVRVFLGE